MSNHNGDETSREGDASLDEKEAAQLTAYALGQLQGEELVEVERKLSASGDGASQREVHEIQAIAAALSSARGSESLPQTLSVLRKLVEQKLAEPASKEQAAKQVQLAKPRKPRRILAIAGWGVVRGAVASTGRWFSIC